MDERERQSQAAQIEALIGEITAFPDEQTRAKIEELLSALLDMYGEGLAHIMEITAEAEVTGQRLIELFAKDDLIGSLLLLYGLHPIDLEARIHQALERVRTSMKAQGGTIELLRIESGTAYLRLTGKQRGCSSSIGALKQRIEDAITCAAPDLDQVCIEEDTTPQQKAIPVKFIPRARVKTPQLAAHGSAD